METPENPLIIRLGCCLRPGRRQVLEALLSPVAAHPAPAYPPLPYAPRPPRLRAPWHPVPAPAFPGRGGTPSSAGWTWVGGSAGKRSR